MTDHTDPENQFILHDRIQALEAENARLREANETWATDYAVQDKAFQATTQQRDELEAENARLRGNYDMAIDALKYMRKQRNEARYWARRYNRVYIASILLTGNIIEQTRDGRYRIAKTHKD